MTDVQLICVLEHSSQWSRETPGEELPLMTFDILEPNFLPYLQDASLGTWTFSTLSSTLDCKVREEGSTECS